MAWKTANYFGAKVMGLPAKTGFSELFSEMQKWDGKHPKQALYQTEPRPGSFGYGSIIHTKLQKSNQKNVAYNIMYKFEKNHNLLNENSFEIVKIDKKRKRVLTETYSGVRM